MLRIGHQTIKFLYFAIRIVCVCKHCNLQIYHSRSPSFLSWRSESHLNFCWIFCIDCMCSPRASWRFVSAAEIRNVFPCSVHCLSVLCACAALFAFWEIILNFVSPQPHHSSSADVMRMLKLINVKCFCSAAEPKLGCARSLRFYLALLRCISYSRH